MENFAATLPPELQEELSALTETGLYVTRDAALADALRTLFAARFDLRETVACRLYEKGVFSLGRAAEWSGLGVEGLKESLFRRGIERQTESEPDRLEAMAREGLSIAGRTAR